MDLVRKGTVKRKMIREIHVELLVTGVEACVLLPDSTGEVDFDTMFYGKDRAFLDWCDDLFDHAWSLAGFFDESRLYNIG